MSRIQILARRILMFSVLAALSTACAPTLKVAEIKRVKKLALIGYEANLNSGDKGVRISFFKDKEVAKENAILAYQQLGAALTKKMGWDVMSHADMTANPEYAAVNQEVLDSNPFARLGASLSKLSQNYNPEGVIWGLYADNLSEEQRGRLFKALGVDAIATAIINVTASSSLQIFFKSSVAYAAQVNFKVRVPNSKEPIWSDGFAKGEAADESSGWNFGPVTVRNDEQKAFIQAIERGYVALFERYDEALKEAQSKANEAQAAPKE